MAYTAEISRTNPTCFLLLVDQSGSMAEPFGADSGKSKAQGVAEAVNRLLQTLVARCAKGEHILDRYHVGVIGYGGEVRLGFPVDGLAGEVLQPVSRIGACPLRIEDRHERIADGAGGWRDRRIKFPVWFEPMSQGKTPMCAAFRARRTCSAASSAGIRGASHRSSSTSATARRPTAPSSPRRWRSGDWRPKTAASCCSTSISRPRATSRSCFPTRISVCRTTTRGDCSASPVVCLPPCSARPASWRRRWRKAPADSPSMPTWPPSSCFWTLARGLAGFSDLKEPARLNGTRHAPRDAGPHAEREEYGRKSERICCYNP